MVDAALEMRAGGRTAYICHTGEALCTLDKPSGRLILAIRSSGLDITRNALVLLPTYRMRLKGVS